MPEGSQTESGTHKVAILGYRHQGSVHHAPAFHKHPRCEIVAVCDIVPERAEAGAERYGVPAYLDADEMLREEDIDIVDIPTGEQYRFDLVMKCLSRGKHVFTEKPLVAEQGQFNIRLSDVLKAREMVEEWLRHEVGFGICFGLHGSPNVRWAKEVVRSGQLGELKMIDARCTHLSSNHVIDLVRFFGGEVAEVFGFTSDPDTLYEKSVALRFESGALGSLVMSSRLALQLQLKWIGECGELTVDNIAGTAWWRKRDSLEKLSWSEETALERSSYYSIFDQLIADFVDSLDTKTPFDADGWAGLRHIEIDAAITESLLTGRPVKVERFMPEQGHTVVNGIRR